MCMCACGVCPGALVKRLDQNSGQTIKIIAGARYHRGSAYTEAEHWAKLAGHRRAQDWWAGHVLSGEATLRG